MIDRETLVSSVKKGLEASNYSSANQLNHPLLEKEEYNSLAHYSQQDDMECRHLLFACSGRLIHSIVSNYISSDNDFAWTYEDLMQSGFLGINYALEKWDGQIGKFTTYAVWYIQREINRQIQKLGNMIVIRDQHLSTLSGKLSKLRSACCSELSRDVSSEEFADWINRSGHSKNIKRDITAEDIRWMEGLKIKFSFDNQYPQDGRFEDTHQEDYKKSEKESQVLLEHLLDTNTISPLVAMIREETRQKRIKLAMTLMDMLTEKQKVVVELYYGFDDAAACSETGKTTFDSVAKVLQKRRSENWDKFKCQQLHQRALKKMRGLISKFGKKLDLNYV